MPRSDYTRSSKFFARQFLSFGIGQPVFIPYIQEGRSTPEFDGVKSYLRTPLFAESLFSPWACVRPNLAHQTSMSVTRAVCECGGFSSRQDSINYASGFQLLI